MPRIHPTVDTTENEQSLTEYVWEQAVGSHHISPEDDEDEETPKRKRERCRRVRYDL